MRQFNVDDDVKILNELLKTPPFDAPHGQIEKVWGEVASRLADIIKDRPINSAALQERVKKLTDNFGQQENRSRRSSGISETVTERDNLIKKYIDLKKVAESDEVEERKKGASVKALALSALKEKAGSSMISEMDPGNSENNPTPNKPAPRKRSGQAQLLDVIDNHFEASNATKGESVMLKRARIEYAQEALKFKTLKYNDRRESMLKKRETEQKKEEVMVALLSSFLTPQKNDPNSQQQQ